MIERYNVPLYLKKLNEIKRLAFKISEKLFSILLLLLLLLYYLQNIMIENIAIIRIIRFVHKIMAVNKVTIFAPPMNNKNINTYESYLWDGAT